MSALLKVKNHASVSQQKVFWKIKPFPACPGAKNRVSQGDPSIFRAPTSIFLMGSPGSCGAGGVHRVDLVMAIGAAVVVMAIEAVLDIVTVLVVQTVMAIVIVLAIETDIHLSGIEPDIKYLLEDAPTRSLLCHRVPRYQVSPDTLNRNYEVRVTSPTPLHHSGGQVEAVVYHQRAEPAALSKPCISSSHHDDFE